MPDQTPTLAEIQALARAARDAGKAAAGLPWLPPVGTECVPTPLDRLLQHRAATRHRLDIAIAALADAPDVERGA